MNIFETLLNWFNSSNNSTTEQNSLSIIVFTSFILGAFTMPYISRGFHIILSSLINPKTKEILDNPMKLKEDARVIIDKAMKFAVIIISTLILSQGIETMKETWRMDNSRIEISPELSAKDRFYIEGERDYSIGKRDLDYESEYEIQPLKHEDEEVDGAVG